MSRVIKAGYARFVAPEESVEERREDEELRETDEADEAEEAAPEQDPDVRAAYDELIEAASNEVAYMLEDARREANSLRAEAIRQAEQASAEAKETGFAEGRAEGQAAGMEEVRAAFHELFAAGQESIDALHDALRREFEERLDALQDDILRLSLGIAEKIIGQRLDAEAEAFVLLVSAALKAFNTDAKLTIRLNPSEFLTRFQGRDSIADERRGTLVPVTADPAVPPGGCWIDAESGIADASVDAQLEQIAYHLGLTNNG